MPRGASQRRRLKNLVKADQEKRHSLALPSPPDNGRRDKKRRKLESEGLHGSASYRKMLQLKAVAESRAAKPTTREAALRQHATPQGSKVSSRINEARDALDGAAPPGERRTSSAPDRHAEQQAVFPSKPLKQRKKDFLRRKRRLKKPGPRAQAAGGGSDGDDTDVEERIMTDVHKPAFGEQAAQPIKMNLKRKHWTGKLEAASDRGRLKHLFVRQMQHAEAKREREATKNTLAEAYREQKQRGRAGKTAATASSLAALVQKNAVAAAAAAD